MKFFAPQGRHVAPMRLKFGREEGTEGSNDKGIGPPKLKLLLRFDRNLEYKRPAGAYPLRDFHKICRVCTQLLDALRVKTRLDLLKGLWSYGVLRRGGRVSHKFSAPPSGETMRQTTKLGMVIEDLEHVLSPPKKVGWSDALFRR